MSTCMPHIIIPPIKCQGIKTKLIPLLSDIISIPPTGLWIEPFLGSGSVLFNICPERAIVSDKNPYIINLYRGLQQKLITSDIVREFLEYHGSLLSRYGLEYYKRVRDDFNVNKDPLYFLFLNHCCFNGMIRFNQKGTFNVPFCKKPSRFSKAYITKICNQVKVVSDIMVGKDWEFSCCDWRNTIKRATPSDYIYLDPPYIGRDTSYLGAWSKTDAIELAQLAHEITANVCLSMWKETEFRTNPYLKKYWSDFTCVDYEHFYHIGAKTSNRHPVIEVVAIKYPNKRHER